MVTVNRNGFAYTDGMTAYHCGDARDSPYMNRQHKVDWCAGYDHAAGKDVHAQKLAEALERCITLLALCSPTVRQVINAGDTAIDAAGLNPYCMNEGLSTGEEHINLSFASDALNNYKNS